MTKVRTTIVLPEETAARLRASVPERKRSEFIAEAIENRLMQLAFRTERERTFGAWRDDDYPHLRTHANVWDHIDSLRDDEGWRRPGSPESG